MSVLKDDLTLKDVLFDALRFSFRFNNYEADWFRNPADPDFHSPPLVGNDNDLGELLVAAMKTFNWKNELRNWQCSLKPQDDDKTQGVIREEDKTSLIGRIELWRAMTEVDGYICCVPSQRQRIAELIRTIQQFFAQEQTYNLSGLLVAKPGSGKTSLARGLAKSLEIRFLDYNITQLVERRDVIACLDTVVTTQAQVACQPVQAQPARGFSLKPAQYRLIGS